LRLEEDAQCSCGFKLSHTTNDRFFKQATLFSENSVTTVFIELARCPVCPRRRHKFIGPDLGNLGIFNKNNCYLYTHRMMDKMTELMCSAEFSFQALLRKGDGITLRSSKITG
ncbi:hypothetical protein BC829DRAFT_367056, partial [Chytridium lagenaria]